MSIKISYRIGKCPLARVLVCCVEHQWFERSRRAIIQMLAHCPYNSKGVPGGNTGELKSAREGTGAQPTSLRRLPKKSVLSNRHSSTRAKV